MAYFTTFLTLKSNKVYFKKIFQTNQILIVMKFLLPKLYDSFTRKISFYVTTIWLNFTDCLLCVSGVMGSEIAKGNEIVP